MSLHQCSAACRLLGALGLVGGLLACPGATHPPLPLDAGEACVDTDGYTDPMASGHVFLVDRFGFRDVDDCLDRDRDGDPDCVINTAMRPLLPMLDGLLSGAVANGRILMAIEAAGLCAPYAGADPAVTLKIYPATDSDGDPTNNLCGTAGCGQVLARPRYMADGQTRYRAEPVPVVDFTVQTVLAGELAINLANNSEPLTVQRLELRCLLPELMNELSDGQLCGVAPVRNVALVMLPLCELAPVLCLQALLPADLSLAEYLAVLGAQPDVDLDDDGLERFELDGNNRVLVCYDGDGRAMGAKDCLQDPEMQDGYSICFDLHGIPGEILGVAEE